MLRVNRIWTENLRLKATTLKQPRFAKWTVQLARESMGQFSLQVKLQVILLEAWLKLWHLCSSFSFCCCRLYKVTFDFFIDLLKVKTGYYFACNTAQLVWVQFRSDWEIGSSLQAFAYDDSLGSAHFLSC